MSQIPETCDYRRPECSNTGMEIAGRWYCLNHLKSEDNPFVKLRQQVEAQQDKITQLVNAATEERAAHRKEVEALQREIERLKAPVSDEEKREYAMTATEIEIFNRIIARRVTQPASKQKDVWGDKTCPN